MISNCDFDFDANYNQSMEICIFLNNLKSKCNGVTWLFDTKYVFDVFRKYG